MVHLLGVLLPDNQVARFALTSFYGIGKKTAHRICARMQIHDTAKIRDLTPNQITSLTAFLSSPSTATPAPHLPVSSPTFAPPSAAKGINLPIARLRRAAEDAGVVKSKTADPLRNLKIETDLKREIRENIAHHRMIGSYVGRRHAMHLPVRGQNTQNNAKSARKLNRIERY